MGISRSLAAFSTLALLGTIALGCSDDTVHAAQSCPVMACGGDVTGTWSIEGACIIEDDCSGESGTVSGTYTFENGSYSYDWTIETSGCGSFGESDSSGGGGYREDGNFLYRGADEQIFEYCVDGDTMELLDLSEFGGERFTLQRSTD
jgi:hypothetical protein